MKKLLPLLLSLLLLLSACSVGSEQSSGGSISVYRMLAPEYQTSGELLEAEAVHIPEGADPVSAAARALGESSSSARLKNPMPSNVRILGAELEGSSVSVEMSPAYYLLSGMDKTMVDSCITLTMCAISGVESVSTHIGGDLIEESLRSGDIMLENTVKTSLEAKVRLYYPCDRRLRYEYRTLSLEAESSPERAAAEALLGGPKSSLLHPALPAGTGLRAIYTQEGVCSVSLSEDFVAACAEQPDNATLWVYSVVNTLCSLSSVSSVSLLIEGKSVSTLGNCDVSHALVKNEKLTGSPIL